MDILPQAHDIGDSPATDLNMTTRLREVCDKLEVEHACFACSVPGNDALIGFATYPETWRKHYLSREFHLIDPTLQKMLHAMAPVDWERLRGIDGYESVFRDAQDFQIPETGISVPIRGPYGERSVLTLATRSTSHEWKLQKKAIMQTVQEMSARLHDEIMRSGKVMLATTLQRLSTREIEILQWVAAGKSQQDVADILNISNRTVEVHLRSARSKLYAVTTAQAVARAISMQLIYPL